MEALIYARLEKLKDEKYQKFSAKLIPNINNILGVRVPALRKLAKELVSDSNFNLENFLKIQSNQYMEFTLLQGFIIGLKKSKKVEFFNDITNFVPKINNWATCDGFCSSLKNIKNYHSEFFNFLKKYLESDKEYELRFGVVMLLNYYVTEEYLDRVLETLVSRQHKEYYAQMAIAWALSMCYIKFFDKTHNAVLNSKLQPEILKKTVQKVCESLKSTPDQREILKKFLTQQ